jgi:hypothetical protein
VVKWLAGKGANIEAEDEVSGVARFIFSLSFSVCLSYTLSFSLSVSLSQRRTSRMMTTTTRYALSGRYK